MELTRPVYVEVRKESGQLIHHCRPLFFTAPMARDALLGLAMSKLSRLLKPQLDGLGKDSRHEPLAAWTFSPPLETHILKLQLILKFSAARARHNCALGGSRIAIARRSRRIHQDQFEPGLGPRGY